MPYRDIPDEAVDAESPFTAYLARRFRDNILYLNNARQALDSQLHATTGHKHTASGTTDYRYSFSDRIETVAGVNDKIDFIYTDINDALTTQKHATLTAGTRTPTAHAAHVQTQMGAVISGGGSMSVTFDTTAGSPTRGHFRMRNTASTGTRRFELLGASGTNAATSALPSMGFAKRDYKKGLGYTSDSGSLDGYTIEQITVSDGGEVDTAGFLDDAFETAKFTNGIIPTGAIQALAVTGAKTANDSIRGEKWGQVFEPTSPVSPQDISPSDTQVFQFSLTGRGASITPCFVAFSTTGHLEQGVLSVSSFSSGGGNVYNVTIANNDAVNTAANVWCVAI